MKNNRREDGRKVKNKRKGSLSNIHKEVQKAANGRKNPNCKKEGVFIVKSIGTGFCKEFSVLVFQN